MKYNTKTIYICLFYIYKKKENYKALESFTINDKKK